jgi:hypothetical protein
VADKPVKLVCENCLLEILESEDYEPLYDDEADGDHVAHSDMATCIARRDALAGENERLRAALDAAKDESARLREELRIVSRYAARLYDGMVNMVEAIDENAGRIWHAALQRGREAE